MDLINILKGIENLAVEILLLIIYIPKTLYRIMSDPFWVSTYIDEQLGKDDKFSEYVSPVLLYLGTSLILYIVSVSTINNEEINLLNKAQDIETLGFLSFPLFVALFIEWFRPGPLSKKVILHALFIQCYFFSPLMLTWFAFTLSNQFWFTDGERLFDFISLTGFPLLFFILTLLWFWGIQVFFIAKDLKINRFKSFGVLAVIVVVLFGMFKITSIMSQTERDQGSVGEWEYVDFRIPENGHYHISIENEQFKDTLGFILILNKFENIRWKENTKWDGISFYSFLETQFHDTQELEVDSEGGFKLTESKSNRNRLLKFLYSNEEELSEEDINHKLDSIDAIKKNRFLSLQDGKSRSHDGIFNINTINETLEDGNMLPDIGVHLYLKMASWDLHALGFKAQTDQHLALMIYPYKSDEDLSFDVYDEKGYSILPWRNEWIRWLRLIYILLFGLAIFIMFRAFLRFGRKEKLIAKNPNDN